MAKAAKEFYEEYPDCTRKPKEGKPVLKLAWWNIFSVGDYEQASGVMASEGHPYIYPGHWVERTSVVIDKTINEEGNTVLETHNSVYELVGKSAKELMAISQDDKELVHE